MKNSVICPSCSFENYNYSYICSNCKSFIRDRVYNLDLWTLIGQLIENPKKAFKLIVLSEHKNFIFFLLIFVAAKLLVNIRFVSLFTVGDFNPSTGLVLSYIIVLALLFFLILAYSFGFTRFSKSFDIHTRFRDNIAIIIYSFLPYVFGIIFIFVIELVVFGRYLFSMNPPPFVIKSAIAYFFAGAEIFLLLWSIFLLFTAFKTQTNSILQSFLNSVAFYGVLAVISFFSSKIIFTF